MTFKQVRKRDGAIVAFDANKITLAITKAGAATNEFDSDIAHKLTREVLMQLDADEIQEIEHIQDIVETVLWKTGFIRTVRAYIVYREQHARLRIDNKTQINVISSIDEYLNKADWRVNANANQGYSLGGLILNSAGKMIANYWLSHVYPPEIGDAHRNADFHIHDLDFLAGYCFTGDTKIALLDGTTPTLKELAETKANETFWVYSRDNNGNIVPGLAHSPRLTRRQAEVMEVSISGGAKIHCTPDHQFMLRDGTYKAAKDLRTYSSLCPLHISTSGRGYLKIKDSKIGLNDYVHRLIAKAQKGYAVHHINGNKRDNRPENLLVMLDSEHKAMELAATKQTDQWKINNRARLVAYNTSKDKRESVSQIASVRERDWHGRFYNHKVQIRPMPAGYEDVYCLTVESYENFALAAGVFVHNCAGWSLRMLLQEGFNGVPGKIEAAPPKHMSSAIGQMVNFLGTLQNEWAGAQAFSSFDTYLAPYVRIDKLNYAQVKQNIQELIYNLNVPSRWGCVPIETKVLTSKGFKKLSNLKINDSVMGYNPFNDQFIIDVVTNVTIFQESGIVYEIVTKQSKQILTANHRVLVLASDNNKPYTITAATLNHLISIQRHTAKLPIITLDHEEQKAFLFWDELLEINKISYTGKVGCPTTRSSYWIAGNDDGIFVTGNSQSPFTNLTFDWTCPEDLKLQVPIIGGKEVDFTYGDLQYEMDLINKAYIEVMTEGDDKGRVFTFPIPTYNITSDFPWNSENANLLFQMTAKFGLPYFQNFLSKSDLKPNMIRSMCCRLQLRLDELLKRGNGLFGSAEQTGSSGVVTINCARLGYLFKGSKTALYQRLNYLLELAKNSLEIKRKVIQRHIDNGLFPYTKRYLGTLRNHFSTIGVNGINEMIRNFTNDAEDITTPNGHKIALDLLDHIRYKIVQFQEQTGHMYNLEATPAEGCSYRFAKEDQKRYNEIIQAGTKDAPYYTNSSQLPVGYTTDAFQALEMQEELQAKYTGGCIEKGNKVFTDKGVLPIEYIVEHYQSLQPISVISYNKNRERSEWDIITDAMIIDVSQHNKIRIKGEKGLDITTSDWHPFFVMKHIDFNGMCPICGLKLKSAKGLPSHFRTRPECKKLYNKNEYEIKEVRADELVVGDYILQNSTNLLPQNSNLDNELAYLIGFFIGNGCISKFIDDRGGNKLVKHSVRFCSEHIKVLEKISQILHTHFDSKAQVCKCDARSSKLLNVATSKNSVYDFFITHGFNSGIKVYDVRINEKIKQKLSADNFLHFLAGLIDSDGHISKRDGCIEYYTVSENLANDLLEICTLAGISISLINKPAKRCNEVNGYRLTIPSFQATLLKNILPVHKSKDSIPDIVSDRLKRQLPVTRVITVDKTSVEDHKFYDLTTQNNHNYLAGKNTFVFVHNTVLHLYMGERISNVDACKNLVKRALERFSIPYLTISPTFSICPIHGYLDGEHEFCPVCDETLLLSKNSNLIGD
jgi:ribonucleoside-triphosphate reductase